MLTIELAPGIQKQIIDHIYRYRVCGFANSYSHNCVQLAVVQRKEQATKEKWTLQVSKKSL